MKRLVLLSLILLNACCFITEINMPALPGKEIEDKDYASYITSIYLWSDKNPEEAVGYMREALKKDPDNETLINDAYMLFAVVNDIQSSSFYADELLTNNDSLFLPAYISITQSLKEKNFDKAYETISKMDDSSYNLYIKPFITAWILAEKGDFENAYKALDPLNEEKVFNAIYNFNMALLKEKEGNLEEAKKYYLMSLNNTSGLSLTAVKFVGKALSRFNEQALSDEILKKYREINFLVNDNVDLSYDDVPDLGYEFAVAETFFGLASIVPTVDSYNRDFATIFYNLAIYTYDDFSLAKILLADNIAGGGRFDASNKIYEKIAPDDEFYIAARLKFARNLLDNGHVSESYKIFYSLADEYPKIIEPFIEMGDYSRMNSDFKNAEKMYSKALDRLDDKTSNVYFVLLYSRGIVLDQQEKWDLAEKDLKESLKLNPDNAFVLNYLGYSWLDRNMNLEEAFDMIKKAYKLNSKDGHTIDSLAWAYYKGGDYKNALKYMEESVSLEPSNSVINDHLGDIYWELGRKDEARYQWKKALELDVDLKEKDKKNIKQKLLKGKKKNVPSFKIKEDKISEKKEKDKSENDKK